MEQGTETVKDDIPGDSNIQPAGEDEVKEEVDQTPETDLIQEKDEGEKRLQGAHQLEIENTEKGETFEEENFKVDPETIEKLTTGVLGLFLPNLQKARGTLNECLHNQEVLIETVQQENAKFTESSPMQKLINTMQEARIYQNKLISLKKEMNILTDRSMKIKKRAVRLQQQKQKEELEKAAQKDREVEKERMLSAKVAKVEK